MGARDWIDRHQGIWEFILFNVLSNISTITRFVMAAAGTWLFVTTLGLTQPFSFLIFDYTGPNSGGLGGFIAFLIAETLAQVVNYFVQMRLVFHSSASAKASAPKYAVLAVVIVVVNLILPGRVTQLCQDMFGLAPSVASVIASTVNTLLAVIVSFPALKFWIAPGDEEADKSKEVSEGNADE